MENLTRTRHNRRREARQARHLDAVAAIRTARRHLPKEHNVVLPFADDDVEVGDGREGIGKVRQLVIVGGEDRLRPGAGARGQVLGHGPGEAEAVERRRAAAYLVENDQASGGCRVQDVRGFLHLHHERGLPACDVVGRANAREDAIHDRQLGGARCHEGTGLRHQRQQCGLPQVRGLPTHVRPGEDDELVGAPVERHIVRHERVGRVPLDDGMAHIGGLQLLTAVHERLRVVVNGGGVGERRQHVQRGQPARRVLHPRCGGRNAGAQPLEQLQLALGNPVVRAKHLVLVLLEGWCDEALPPGDRLLAGVVGGDIAQVRPGDFDVVAEHPVIANLEGADAGSGALALFHLRDAAFPGAADVAQVVELQIDAVADDAPIAR